MEQWPRLRLVQASSVAPGSLVQWNGHLAMVALHAGGKAPLLVMFGIDRFEVGATDFRDLQVLHIDAEVVLDFSEVNLRQELPMRTAGPDTSLALLIGNEGPQVVVSSQGIPRIFALLNLETATLQARGDGAFPSFDRWRLGVRLHKDSIKWLFQPGAAFQADFGG